MKRKSTGPLLTKRELVRINKLRDLWVIRGYFGAHVKKEKRS